MGTIDDLALLREYAARNSEAAFETLVSRRVNFVYSAALRQVRDPQLAAEITQAVFIILARKAWRISDRTILTGWLFKTTRFAARAELRNAALRRRREQEAQMQSEIPSPPPDPEWEQMSPLLDEALAALGETDRQAVLLRFFENKSLAEVGVHLGTGEDTARKRVARALEKLRRYFSKRGAASTTVVIAGMISANSVQAAPVALAKSATVMALTKGVAASGSTLTLIKGALKLMAWTKAKLAVVVGVSVFLATGTATVIVKEAHNHAVWNDNQQALDAAPPMVILRPTKFPPSRAGGILLSQNGKLAVRCQPVKDLLVHAFNCSPSRMVIDTSLPDGFFDYLVTLPENQGEALQQKIRVQLHMVGRREIRETAVYVVKGKPASELKPVSAEGAENTVENGHYQGRMSDMWYSLEHYLKTPVLAEIDPSS